MEAFGRKMFEIVGMIFGQQPENLRKFCGNGKKYPEISGNFVISIYSQKVPSVCLKQHI